jgi:transposase
MTVAKTRESEREEFEITERQQKVARLYIQGKYQSQIADELKVDPATVSRDIQAIRENWRASALFDYSTAIGRELALLDAVEKEAWAEYLKSKEATVKDTRESIANVGVKVSVTKTTRTGDPRYLAIVMECSEKRAKLMGLITERTHHSGAITVNTREMSDAQLLAIAAGSGG